MDLSKYCGPFHIIWNFNLSTKCGFNHSLFTCPQNACFATYPHTMWTFPQSAHDFSVVLPKMSTFFNINDRKLGLQVCGFLMSAINAVHYPERFVKFPVLSGSPLALPVLSVLWSINLSSSLLLHWTTSTST